MTLQHHDSQKTHNDRLKQIRALLSAPIIEKHHKKHKFGRFTWLGLFIFVLGFGASLTSYVPMQASASHKTNADFTSVENLTAIQNNEIATLSPVKTTTSFVPKAAISKAPLSKVPLPKIPLPKMPPLSKAPPLSKPMIALVIDDVGAVPQWSHKVVQLPAAITLAILPNVMGAEAWAERATMAGHEVLLHMPMEPVGLENPGPGALLTALPAQQNQARLKRALLRVPGAIGVNNHMGSRFTSCVSCVSSMAGILRDHGLLFLDSRTSATSKAANTINQAGVVTASRDVFLDDDNAMSAIASQMRHAEKLARKTGIAIVIAHPRPNTLVALQSWQESLTAAGIELVSLSAAIAQKQAIKRQKLLRSAGLGALRKAPTLRGGSK